MFVYSDPAKDVRHVKITHGSYEWWYFDFYDQKTEIGFVVIFYDGLLFSPDYHRAQAVSARALPAEHPGISISVYKGDTTVFYALHAYSEADVEFGDLEQAVRIGNNFVFRRASDQSLIYEIHIDEKHPSGYVAEGVIRFESKPLDNRFSCYGNVEEAHHWNLIQPKAKVTGTLHITLDGNSKHVIDLDGAGYHDHNIGLQPLGNDFKDWYWGRVHFVDRTLIWYLMDRVSGPDRKAWIIYDDTSRKSIELNVQKPSRRRKTRFGLQLDTILNFESAEDHYAVELRTILDNGPFYLRYRAEALYTTKGSDEKASGLAEFIKPDRIQARWVRPLIEMRYHHHSKKAGWIQKSSLLSPFTW